MKAIKEDAIAVLHLDGQIIDIEVTAIPITYDDQDAKHIVSQINSALHRMETGDYGICIKCGAEISEGRLEIVPYAALCIKCAEESD